MSSNSRSCVTLAEPERTGSECGGGSGAVESVVVPAGGLREAVDAYQRRVIADMLAASQGNWTQAAQQLGIDRANLRRLARRLGIG
mgnify:CR=1 FL=1